MNWLTLRHVYALRNFVQAVFSWVVILGGVFLAGTFIYAWMKFVWSL